MQVGSSFLISFVLAVAALLLTVAGVPVARKPESPRATIEGGGVRPVASLQATPVDRSPSDLGSGFSGLAAGVSVSGDLEKTAANR